MRIHKARWTRLAEDLVKLHDLSKVAGLKIVETKPFNASIVALLCWFSKCYSLLSPSKLKISRKLERTFVSLTFTFSFCTGSNSATNRKIRESACDYLSSHLKPVGSPSGLRSRSLASSWIFSALSYSLPVSSFDIVPGSVPDDFINVGLFGGGDAHSWLFQILFGLLLKRIELIV